MPRSFHMQAVDPDSIEVELRAVLPLSEWKEIMNDLDHGFAVFSGKYKLFIAIREMVQQANSTFSSSVEKE